jgi:hypothetical protein
MNNKLQIMAIDFAIAAALFVEACLSFSAA